MHVVCMAWQRADGAGENDGYALTFIFMRMPFCSRSSESGPTGQLSSIARIISGVFCPCSKTTTEAPGTTTR